MKKLNIVVVGMGFGIAFLPIYLDHPNVGKVGFCDMDIDVLNEIGEKYPNAVKYDSFEKVLADKTIDAVHLVTPFPYHAEHSIAVLQSGKHCACTVPMATSLDDIRKIIDAKHKSGKNYMMMETALYTSQYFYVKELLEKGDLGRIQFLRGSHYQDMIKCPDCWMGLPPMWYSTHAIAPMVALAGSRIKRVNCFGSGTMDSELQKQYNNPFPIESALLEFENGLKGEVTRSLFETARAYQEGLFVYGSKLSFEWGFADNDKPYVTSLNPYKENQRMTTANITQISLPNHCLALPENIQKHCKTAHHGSHPHLVHEFVMSILENRKPLVDEVLGANITAAGICAHESAMKNGESVIVPEF